MTTRDKPKVPDAILNKLNGVERRLLRHVGAAAHYFYCESGQPGRSGLLRKGLIQVMDKAHKTEGFGLTPLGYMVHNAMTARERTTITTHEDHLLASMPVSRSVHAGYVLDIDGPCQVSVGENGSMIITCEPHVNVKVVK